MTNAIEYYQAKEDGTAVKLDPQKIAASGGYVKPTAKAILTIPNGIKHSGDRRIAVFPPGGSVAWPLTEPNVRGPHNLGQTDLKNLYGPLVPNALNDVTDIPNAKKWQTILLWIAVGVNTLIGIGCLILLGKISNYIFG